MVAAVFLQKYVLPSARLRSCLLYFVSLAFVLVAENFVLFYQPICREALLFTVRFLRFRGFLSNVFLFFNRLIFHVLP